MEEKTDIMSRTARRNKVQPDDALALTELIVQACADAKGNNIVVLDVAEVFGLADYFVIVDGRSDRQVQGICNKVLENLGREGVQPHALEGLDEGHWVLVDFGDVIVHVFYEPVRAHFNLEGLWIKAGRLIYDDRKAVLVKVKSARLDSAAAAM
jgi:ribosome-associated protein